MRKTQKKAIIVVGLISLLAVFYLLGLLVYKKIGDKLISKYLPKTIENKTTTNQEGSTSNKETLDKLPKDFPIYQNAELDESWTTSGEGIGSVSAVWETNDSVNVISEYYKNEFRKGGWNIDSEISIEGSAVMSFSKNTIKGFMGITKKENNTVISITMTLKIEE